MMTPKNASPEDPRKTRTRAAIAANMKSREKKAAALLSERGWGIVTPYDETDPADIEEARMHKTQAIELLRQQGYTITKG